MEVNNLNNLAKQILQHIDEQPRTSGYKLYELNSEEANRLMILLRQARPDVMFEVHRSANGLVLEIHRY